MEESIRITITDLKPPHQPTKKKSKRKKLVKGSMRIASNAMRRRQLQMMKSDSESPECSQKRDKRAVPVPLLRNRLFDPISLLKHASPKPNETRQSPSKQKKEPSVLLPTPVKPQLRINYVTKDPPIATQTMNLKEPQKLLANETVKVASTKRDLHQPCAPSTSTSTGPIVTINLEPLKIAKVAPVARPQSEECPPVASKVLIVSPQMRGTEKESMEEEDSQSSSDPMSCQMPKVIFHVPPAVPSLYGTEIYLPFFTNKYVFSNHFPCRGLKIDEHTFNCTEQYYMWKKAMFSGNKDAAEAILMAKDPKQMKLIGSSLDSFNVREWQKRSWKTMMEANLAKYKQFAPLRYQLFRTSGGHLVEASPTDKWWGIGLDMDSVNINDESKWNGANVMGEILMTIRDILLEKEEYAEEIARAREHLLVNK